MIIHEFCLNVIISHTIIESSLNSDLILRLSFRSLKVYYYRITSVHSVDLNVYATYIFNEIAVKETLYIFFNICMIYIQTYNTYTL